MSTVDITQDLTDGSDGALADAVNPNAVAGAAAALNDGAVHVNADIVQTADPKPGSDNASLRDQLSNAFKGEPDPADPAAVTPDAKPADVPQLSKDAEGRWRQPDGTFASTEQVAAFEAAQAATAQPALEIPEETLRGMTPTELQQFQSLPAELRTFVGRTMEDLNNRATRYSEYDLIEQSIIGPRRALLAQAGSNPAAALNELFALSDFAGQDPGRFVLWFAQTRGIDLDALLDAQEQAGVADPHVQQLQGTVQQLQAQLQSMTAQQQSGTDQQRVALVENFVQEKDAQGNPRRPYLADVTNEWAQQIAVLKQANPTAPDAEILQKAYETACWANPGVRAKMQQEVLLQQQQSEAARVAAAKAAGSSVNGAPSGSTPATNSNTGNLSLRDELALQFAAAKN